MGSERTGSWSSEVCIKVADMMKTFTSKLNVNVNKGINNKTTNIYKPTESFKT